MVVDSVWGGSCGSILECEYSQYRPAVAFIMLGMQDAYFLSPAQYEESMRQIVEVSIEQGVIPVLTTIPTLPGDNPTRDQNRILFNEILVRLAQEYDVPLMNLWLAMQSVDNHGLIVNEDSIDFSHVSHAVEGVSWANFNGDEQRWGFTMWNLVLLQTLDRLRTIMG